MKIKNMYLIQVKISILCISIFSVDLSSVCNGRLDCPDKSDEIECESIIFDESYLNNVPPTEHGKKQIKKIIMNLGITSTFLYYIVLSALYNFQKPLQVSRT